MISRAALSVLVLLLLSMPALSQDNIKQGGGSLDIANVIRAVHKELIASERMRKEQGLQGLFRTKQFELELNFVVSSSAEGRGGIELQVVGLGGFDLGARGEVKQEQIQKIKLVFETIEGAPGAIPRTIPDDRTPRGRPQFESQQQFRR